MRPRLKRRSITMQKRECRAPWNEQFPNTPEPRRHALRAAAGAVGLALAGRMGQPLAQGLPPTAQQEVSSELRAVTESPGSTAEPAVTVAAAACWWATAGTADKAAQSPVRAAEAAGAG
jgi:hypothetical protein